MSDPIAEALADGSIAPHEVDLARRLMTAELDQYQEDHDPEDTLVAAQLAELPAGRIRATYGNGRRITASAGDDAYRELYGDDLDREVDRLSPPGARHTSTPRPLTAAAGPWNSGDPVSWAVQTGRITAADRGRWADWYAADPVGTAGWIAVLTPPSRAQRIAAAAIEGRPVSARSSAADLSEYSALYGDNLDREVDRLSPPRRVALAASGDDSDYRALYGSN